MTTQLWHSSTKATIGNINDCGCVPIKFHLQKQMAYQIWNSRCSFPALDLAHENIHQQDYSWPMVPSPEAENLPCHSWFCLYLSFLFLVLMLWLEFPAIPASPQIYFLVSHFFSLSPNTSRLDILSWQVPFCSAIFLAHTSFDLSQASTYPISPTNLFTLRKEESLFPSFSSSNPLDYDLHSVLQVFFSQQSNATITLTLT